MTLLVSWLILLALVWLFVISFYFHFDLIETMTLFALCFFVVFGTVFNWVNIEHGVKPFDTVMQKDYITVAILNDNTYISKDARIYNANPEDIVIKYHEGTNIWGFRWKRLGNMTIIQE